MTEALGSWKLGNPWVGITLKFLSCFDLFRPPVRLHFPVTSSGHWDSPEEKRLETRKASSTPGSVTSSLGDKFLPGPCLAHRYPR